MVEGFYGEQLWQRQPRCNEPRGRPANAENVKTTKKKEGREKLDGTDFLLNLTQVARLPPSHAAGYLAGSHLMPLWRIHRYAHRRHVGRRSVLGRRICLPLLDVRGNMQTPRSQHDRFVSSPRTRRRWLPAHATRVRRRAADDPSHRRGSHPHEPAGRQTNYQFPGEPVIAAFSSWKMTVRGAAHTHTSRTSKSCTPR